ncbi:MAG: hypothetical protein K2I97_06100, partial [Alistipes sp.]|nr:hypothetical protein [Alistipes sp.]
SYPNIKKRANHSTLYQGFGRPIKKIEELPAPKNGASIVLKSFFMQKCPNFDTRRKADALSICRGQRYE